MDVSGLSVAGYFSEVQPGSGQLTMMEKNLLEGSSVLRDRHLAHSGDWILAHFKFCGWFHPIREASGLVGLSLPEPMPDHLSDCRFKNQSAFLTPISSNIQFNGPIYQQDDYDLYLVHVHPRNNRTIRVDLEEPLEDEVVDSDSKSVVSHGSKGARVDLLRYGGQSKIRILLHTNYQVPSTAPLMRMWLIGSQALRLFGPGILVRFTQMSTDCSEKQTVGKVPPLPYAVWLPSKE